MAEKSQKAICLLCKSTYTETGITKHIKTCLSKTLKTKQKQQKDMQQSYFHVLIRGYFASAYWLHLMVAGNLRLEDLDQFLRNIWLECCGHLSAFSYQRYELEMRLELKDIFQTGMELLHEYDFGTPTALTVRVLGKYQAPLEKDKPIQILSRNEAPEILCDECGETLATEICTECQWESGGWLCDSCAEDHECDKDMLLPVVNSPRVGVCGYCG